MIDWLTDLGFTMAAWPPRAQSFLQYAYIITFGISGFVDEWLRRRAKAGRPAPHALFRYWTPVYFAALLAATISLFSIATATRAAIEAGSLPHSLSAESQAYIRNLQRTSGIGFLLIAWIAIAVWEWIRRSRATVTSQDSGHAQD